MIPEVGHFSNISSDYAMHSNEEPMEMEIGIAVGPFHKLLPDFGITIASFLNVAGLDSAKKVCKTWQFVFQKPFLENITLNSCRKRMDNRRYVERAMAKKEGIEERRPEREMRMTKRLKLNFDGDLDFPVG